MSVTDADGWELAHVDDEHLPVPRGKKAYDPRQVRSMPLRGKVNRTKVQQFDPSVMNRLMISGSTPETPIQALVEAGVEEPDESALERELRIEPLRRAIEECLTERERWVIECKFWRGLGVDLTAQLSAEELGLAKNYSKQHIARIRDQALAKLRDHLGPLFDTEDEDDGDDGAGDGGTRGAERAPDRGDRSGVPLP